MCVCVCVRERERERERKRERESLSLSAGSSPVMLSGLSHGKHVLKVVPTGCGRNRMNLKTTITIE